MGVRGDAIAQFDWTVGQIIAALEERGLRENTLIILSSDNGPVVDDGYDDHAEELLNGHSPAGPFRGNKYRNTRFTNFRRLSITNRLVCINGCSNQCKITKRKCAR